MIIGIDGNEANVEKRVGVNEYAFQILSSLKKLQEKGENPHILIVYLQNEPLPDMPKESANFKYIVIPGRGLWILTKLMPYLFLSKEKPDVLFTPSHYLPPFSPMPKVCSIMDLGYLEFSGQFTKKVFWQLKWWTAISLFVSKRIIAISNSTKSDIVRHYPFAKDKVQVTYLAYDPKRFNNTVSEKDVRRIKNKYSIVDDYILYLGTLKPSKNIESLVQAFLMLNDKQSLACKAGKSHDQRSRSILNLKLVIAGKKGWMFESIFKKVKELKLGDKVIFTDFIEEEDKPALIRGAKVFVLPSFWEGFGLDALNAMASGVPVVVSNVGSLPEVVGGAGVLIDPNSINSIADGIENVLNLSKINYNSMVKKGLDQAKKFNWEKTARETLKILETSY